MVVHRAFVGVIKFQSQLSSCRICNSILKQNKMLQRMQAIENHSVYSNYQELCRRLWLYTVTLETDRVFPKLDVTLLQFFITGTYKWRMQFCW